MKSYTNLVAAQMPEWRIHSKWIYSNQIVKWEAPTPPTPPQDSQKMEQIWTKLWGPKKEKYLEEDK
jgi:hypothetical protein